MLYFHNSELGTCLILLLGVILFAGLAAGSFHVGSLASDMENQTLGAVVVFLSISATISFAASALILFVVALVLFCSDKEVM